MLPEKNNNTGNHQGDGPQQIQVKPRFAEQRKSNDFVNNDRYNSRHNEKTEGMYANCG